MEWQADEDDRLQDDRQSIYAPGYRWAYDAPPQNYGNQRTGPYFTLQEDNITAEDDQEIEYDEFEGRGLVYDVQEHSETSDDSDTQTDEPPLELPEIDRSSDEMFSEEEDEETDEMSEDSQDSGAGLKDEGRRGPRPRGRPPRGTVGRGPSRRRGWKWAVAGTIHDPKARRREETASQPRGRPKGRGFRGLGRGRRRGQEAIVPSGDFQRAQNEATQAISDGNLELASEKAREAIHANPEIFAAHALLSESLDGLGKKRDSLLALIAGAHTGRDTKVWYDCAERTISLPGEDIRTLREQALYCYSKVISIDQNEYPARLRRMDLYIDLGRSMRAKTECDILRRARPYEPGLGYAMIRLSSTPEEKQRALEDFDEVLKNQLEGRIETYMKVNWVHLRLYIDLLCELGLYEKALSKLSEVSRWLLGRRSEAFWDPYPADDREWDIEHTPRRTMVQGFDPSLFDRTQYGEGLPIEIRVQLGSIRLNMGPRHQDEAIRHFRHLEPNSEALNAPIFAHEDLFHQVANELKEHRCIEEAVEFYECLTQLQRVVNPRPFHALSDCYREIGKRGNSRQCLRTLIEMNDTHIDTKVKLAKICEEDDELAEASELVAEVIRQGRADAVKRAKLRALKATRRKQSGLGSKSKKLTKGPVAVESSEAKETSRTLRALAPKPLALTAEPSIPPPNSVTTHPGLVPRNSAPESEKQAEKPKEKAPNKERSKKTTQAFNEEIYEFYQRMKQLEEEGSLEDPEALEEWMSLAEILTDDFRSDRVFYSEVPRYNAFENNRRAEATSAMGEMKSLALRLQNTGKSATTNMDPSETMPTDYCNIPFSEWLNIFCEYALQLAKWQEAETCYSAIGGVLNATVFNVNDSYMHSAHVCWLACALLMNDEQTVCNVSRWFMKRYPYTNEAIALFSIANRALRCTPNWYNSGPTQKFLLRHIKGMDFALLDPEDRDKFGFTETEKSGFSRDGNPNPHGLTEMDPGLLMLYGHVLSVTGSYNNALNYYFRAYALVPNNATINLCLGLSYIQMGLKRQSENRQFELLQGRCFIQEYYKIQMATGKAILMQEAEYNRAWSWHLLGLMHLAIPGYEKCLELSSRVQEEAKGKQEDGVVEDFATDAAYALQTIFIIVGNYGAARAVTEKHMVLE